MYLTPQSKSFEQKTNQKRFKLDRSTLRDVPKLNYQQQKMFWKLGFGVFDLISHNKTFFHTFF